MKLTTIYNKFINEASKGTYIAYHGTTTEIIKFTDDFVDDIENPKPAQEGSGIYFTTNLSDAKQYGGNVYKVRLTGTFISRQTPVSRVDRGKVIELMKMVPDWEMDAQNWHPNPTKGLQIALRSILDASNDEGEVFQYIEGDFYRGIGIQFVRNMVKLGYDGLVTTAPSGFRGDKHIIMYNPNAIQLLEKVQ